MKRTEDFIRELESSNVLMSKEVTFNEYVNELLGFQSVVCKMVAGDAYHEQMRIDEALFLMESTARKNDVRNHPAVHNGIITMKKLSKELAITMSGAKGESLVSKTLEYLNRPNTKVYRNVYITDGQDETELDAIVLTDAGVIILEVKKVKSDLTLTEDGRMVFASDECYDKIPLGEKMALKRKLLKNALEKAVASTGLDIPVYVDSYIVFSAPKGQYIKIDDRYRKEKHCFRTGLNQKIDNYLGCAYYKEDQLNQLDEIFTAMESNVKRFETELNYDDVRRSLAEAMVVLQNEPESTIEPQVSNDTERKAKIIEANIVREKLAQKTKKSVGFDYIAAGAAACVLGFAMMLGLGFKRA